MEHPKFDLSKFKKVDSNDTHTMFQHPDGHIIYVAHKALSKEQTGDAKALPFSKMNKGGYVPPPKGPKLDKEKTAAFTKGLRGAFGVKGMAQGGMVTEEDEADVMAALEGEKAANTQMVDSYLPERPMEGYTPVSADPAPALPDFTPTEAGATKAAAAAPTMPTTAPAQPSPLDQQLKGIQAQADAESQFAKDEAALAKKREKELGDIQGRFDKQIADLEIERESLFTAAKQGSINPNAYAENLSTPAKIATLIGIFLGGVGDEGSGNMALKQFNTQVDRDVKSQEANLDKQNNLLKYNLQRTQNMQDAVKLTKAQVQEIYAAKIEQAAARAKNPMAQAKAQQAIAQIRQQQATELAPVIARMALSKAPMSIEAAQGLIEGPLVPKERRAEAAKELEFVAGLQQGMKDASAAYDNLKNIDLGSVALGQIKPGGTDASRALAQANATIEGIVRANRPPGSGPMSDQDAVAMIDPYKLSIGDLTDPKAIEAKQRGLLEKLNAGFSKTGTLASLGIKLKSDVMTPPKDSTAATGFDPRAAAAELERRKKK